MARSLSGASVDLVNRHVRQVYLDEAGTSNPSQEPFLVVAGIIINADQDWLPLDRHLKSIMRKRLPEELQYTGIFHAKDIWHGSRDFQRPRWPLAKRMEILADLAAIPAKFHLSVVHGFVERGPAAVVLSEIFRKPTDATIGILTHSVAFMRAAGAVDLWMRRNAPNEVAMLVAEDAGKVKQAVRMFQDGYRQDQVDSYFVEIKIKGYPKNVFQTRQIVDTVHFAGKRESPLLQIADTCAFVIKRQLQNAADIKPYFDAFASQMVSPLTENGWPEKAS
jgi:hypothetical protein